MNTKTNINNNTTEESNISVYLRVKPTAYALNLPPNSSIKIADTKIILNKTIYNLDNIFIHNNQSEIYKFIIQKQIEKTFQGYNCTIMAYGQTGSGKTYTIQGTETNYGIVLRVLCQIFELIDKKIFNLKDDDDNNNNISNSDTPLRPHAPNQADIGNNISNNNSNIPHAPTQAVINNNNSNNNNNEKHISIKISYVEIYNEIIQDLLSKEENFYNEKNIINAEKQHKIKDVIFDDSFMSSDVKYKPTEPVLKNPLKTNAKQKAREFSDCKPKIRENAEGTYVSNITTTQIKSLEEAKEIFSLGNQKRSIASTKMNDKSSRSHTIFTIHLELKENSIIKKSKINLVDLAGSESLKNVKISKDNKETGNINKSLFYLSEVIKKLSINTDQHINYRDSKLTHLLKDSLAGNSILLVIGTVNLEFIVECQNTLNFLKRTKNIKKLIIQNFDLKEKNNKFYYEELKALSNENHLLILENSKLKNRNFSKKYEKDDLDSVLTELKTIKEDLDNLDELIKKMFLMKLMLKQDDILKKDDEWFNL
ncbi:Kinesin-like protein Klp61F [Cucumispora dikerogammari]|nr:Kinesin-like protein Klp61F [Cucumispora dikerogammari]